MNTLVYYYRLIEHAPSDEILVGVELDPGAIGLHAEIEDEISEPLHQGGAVLMYKYGFTAVVPSTVRRFLVFVFTDPDLCDEDDVPEAELLVNMALSPEMAGSDTWVLSPSDLHPFGAWQHDPDLEGDLVFLLLMLHEMDENDVAVLEDYETDLRVGTPPFLSAMRVFDRCLSSPNADVMVQHLYALESADPEETW